MPSVLVALEESLSSLSQWRAAVSGHQHTDDEITDHVPLKSLLLPLACVAVFETKLLRTLSRCRWYVLSVHTSESRLEYTCMILFICMREVENGEQHYDILANDHTWALFDLATLLNILRIIL